MLEYKVIVSDTNKPTLFNRIKPITPDQPDYRKHIFERLVKQTDRYQVGTRIKVRGTPNKGTITYIEYDLDKIKWQKNKPYYIEIRLENGESFVAHPSQLKTTQK